MTSASAGAPRLTHPELKLAESLKTIRTLLRLRKAKLALARYHDMWDQCCELEHPHVGAEVRAGVGVTAHLSSRCYLWRLLERRRWYLRLMLTLVCVTDRHSQ